jgi:hypothetical protein
MTPMKNNRTAHTATNTSCPLDLLRDPKRATVSVSQAAAILGVAKSTAHAAYKQTGYLSPGVPVMQVGRRYTVSVFHLRAALGMTDPDGDL